MSQVPSSEVTPSLTPSSSPSTPPAQAPRRGWVKPVIFLLLAVLVGAIVWRTITARQEAKATQSKQAGQSNRPTPVQVTAVSQRPMPVFLTALGTVTPYNSVTVKAQVGGQLTRVNFQEGQEVHKGQVLATIDPRPYQATLDQARGTLAHDEALLKNAQAQYARYQALYKEGVVSRETMEQQESSFGQYQGAIQSDQAAIQNDQLQVRWCSVTSPINGRVGLRLVDAGNIIAANTTNLVIINQLKPIAVYFTLPEDQMPQVLDRLRKSEKLKVEAWDRTDTTKLAEGSLLTADNQLDTTTGTGKLKAVFPNDDNQLFPNQFVNIHLILEVRQNALVVPTAAIQSGTQGNFVWVVKPDGTAAMQPIQIDMAEGQLTLLSGGVAAGDKLVVDGADKLRPGSKVDAREAQHKGNHAQSGGGNYSSLAQGSSGGYTHGAGPELTGDTAAGGHSHGHRGAGAAKDGSKAQPAQQPTHPHDRKQ